MAETVVSPVIDRLVQLLVEEAKLLKGVNRDVQSLKDELESIKCFLKDAEARSEKEHTNGGVRTWVKQVRDEANRIEDVIDEYLRHVSPRRHRSGFLNFLKKIGSLVERLKARHIIISEVKDIKTSLREIQERSERYDFQRHSSEEVSGGERTCSEQCEPRLVSHLIEEDEVVGIDSIRNDLKRKLVKGATARMVISLVGTGGIGKTTLARIVYDDELVKQHFNCYAWITVSQTYDIKKVLKKFTKQICINSECIMGETDTIEESVSSLRQYLKTKRYVVVFDDIWDIKFWEVMKHALPKNEKGSRIIVTTRNDTVAAVACQETSCDHVHKLEPLSDEMARNLFYRKAFRSQTRCPKELEDLSLRLVRKCQGLPLVITAIACLLSTKEKIILEWQKVLDNMSSEFEDNVQLKRISNIISLSYNDLPYHLKSCLLYFGIFPEDHSVAESTLCKMWIAEGFVNPKKDMRLEDVAKEYLEELIHRNLVQVSHSECRGSDRLCKVHDMMREVILLKIEELGFCQMLDEKNSRFRSKYRRLSIRGSTENVQEIVKDSGVRSVFIFDASKLTERFMVTLFESFKLLRVLYFKNTLLDCLPKEVGNFFHLKYLCLTNTKVKILPKSIGKLQKLQTLDLVNTLVCELPCEINDLRRMRHILTSHNHRSFKTVPGMKLPKGIGCLEDLQTLCSVEAHEGPGAVSELEKLRQLRMLSISKLTTETGKALCAFIEKMNYLEDLALSSVSEDEILDLECISSPPYLLRFLSLRGPLQKLPCWISMLHNLLEIWLFHTKLLDDQLRILHSLPNLQKLYLYHAYDTEKFHFKEGGFQKLKFLNIRDHDGLKEVQIDRGALPCLQTLGMWAGLLREVPSGIQHLTSLKTLRFFDLPGEFVNSLEPCGGQDYWKVRHVTSVTFWKTIFGDPDVFLGKLRESDPINICCKHHLKPV